MNHSGAAARLSRTQVLCTRVVLASGVGRQSHLCKQPPGRPQAVQRTCFQHGLTRVSVCHFTVLAYENGNFLLRQN
jgi:hypothetical protein